MTEPTEKLDQFFQLTLMLKILITREVLFVKNNKTSLAAIFSCHFMNCLLNLQLSSRTEMPNTTGKIFEILVQYLCIQHIDYAIELGLQGELLTR